ncbi:MAG: ankyrin repeat domain-containing protein [Pirellulales bacterium]
MPDWDQQALAEFLRLADTDVAAAASFARRWPQWLARGDGEESLLHYLAVEDELNAVDALIQAGADLRDSIDWFSSPVFDVAMLGYQDLLALLLRSGCSANTASISLGLTALQCAIEHGHTECVRLLLAAGADVERGSPLEGPPLHTAAKADQVELAGLLLDAGVDPNSADTYERNTALHHAAQRGNAALARLLLDHGAAPTAVNGEGHTPADLAAAAGHYEVVAAILQ